MPTFTNEQLLASFDRFREQIDKGYELSRQQLEAGEYVAAWRTLAAIARSHATAAMKLRNILIRNNLMPGGVD